MSIDLQYKINSDPKLINFLHEYSYWYKYLNRDTNYFKELLCQ